MEQCLKPVVPQKGTSPAWAGVQPGRAPVWCRVPREKHQAAFLPLKIAREDAKLLPARSTPPRAPSSASPLLKVCSALCSCINGTSNVNANLAPEEGHRAPPSPSPGFRVSLLTWVILCSLSEGSLRDGKLTWRCFYSSVLISTCSYQGIYTAPVLWGKWGPHVSKPAL